MSCSQCSRAGILRLLQPHSKRNASQKNRCVLIFRTSRRNDLRLRLLKGSKGLASNVGGRRRSAIGVEMNGADLINAEGALSRRAHGNGDRGGYIVSRAVHADGGKVITGFGGGRQCRI